MAESQKLLAAKDVRSAAEASDSELCADEAALEAVGDWADDALPPVGSLGPQLEGHQFFSPPSESEGAASGATGSLFATQIDHAANTMKQDPRVTRLLSELGESNKLNDRRTSLVDLEHLDFEEVLGAEGDGSSTSSASTSDEEEGVE